MDGYCGTGGERQRSNSGAPGDDDGVHRPLAPPPLAADDDIDREPPPVSVGQNERRMQVRAYNYWASLLGDRPVPQIEDLVSARTPDFAEHAVVLDFSAGIADPAVTMLGAKLAEECGAATTIERLSDVPDRSLLSRITDHYLQLLVNQAPIGFEAEFVNQRGKTLLYRGILLPFSSDGANIQHIMGVINWKELADATVTAQLLHELDNAVGAAYSPASRPGLPAWADGPVAAGAADSDVALLPAADSDAWELADSLTLARESAQEVIGLAERSRVALYAAIGRAWDFALAAEANPAVFRDMLTSAGLAKRAPAPLMPVARLVFGAEYDQARLAEIVAALAHARSRRLERGTLAIVLAETPGGLKAVVREERRLRRARLACDPTIG